MIPTHVVGQPAARILTTTAWFIEKAREIMATKLEKPLKRELEIEGKAYMLTIAPDGLKLVEKGRRKGLELAWKDVVSGDAGLAAALNASLDKT